MDQNRSRHLYCGHEQTGQKRGLRVPPRIKGTVTQHDTIIYEYALSGTRTHAAEQAHQSKLTALVGKPLPAFMLSDLQGKLLDSQRLLGKPIVLNFWFTSCAPCLAEMPVLNRIRAEKTSTEVVFLALTFEGSEKVQAFLKKHSFTFRHLVGAKRYCDQLAIDYPTSIFVDKTGIIRSVLGAIPLASSKEHDAASADAKEFYAALKQIE